jgi:PAS domain S-box-containing protein
MLDWCPLSAHKADHSAGEVPETNSMTALSSKVGRYEKVPDYLYAQASRWTAAIAGALRFWLGPGGRARFAFWPTALFAIVIIKAGLSLTLNPDSFLIPYLGVPYFLLLLLATGFAIRNGTENTLGSRPFWVFLAIGTGLWALDQWIYLYYGLGLHTDVPDNSIADSVLFLHIALLMAAVAAFPHRSVSDRKLYPAILNSILLVIFWGFLYVYAVFPHQLYANPTSYALGFDVLYPLENWVLILAVGFLSVRASHPWKSIYLHLLGASTLYALSSVAANLAIDSGGYINGKLYGVGLTAAACWFVWIPLRARRSAGTELQATRSDSGQSSKASAWAMVVVVLISIPIVWELLRQDDATGMRTFRILVAIAAIVCLASAAFIKEYLGKSELAASLGSANDRLNLAMEFGKAVGWEWDVKSKRISWFGDLKTNFGIDSETHVESAEEFFQRYVHAEDRERVSEAISDAKGNHGLYEGEFRVVWPDGTLRWVTAKGEFQYSTRGEPERMLGMAVDITERKQLQTELLESQDRIVSIVASAMDAIIAVDEAHRIVLFNDAAEKMFDCPREEAVGSPVERFIPLRFRDQHITGIHRFGETGSGSRTMGTPGILWALRANGEEFPIEASISQSNFSGKLSFTVIIRDVTEQRRTEQGLRKSEERFRLFMSHSPAVAWMKDEQGHYIYMNETYLKHFGIRLEDRRGKTDFEIYPRAIAEQFRENDEAALAAGHPIEVTEDSIGPDGEPCTWLAYKFPFEDTSGQIFVGGIGIDITERKKARESLQALTGRLIDAQEEERARISRELHDDFSQRLALLGIGLGQLWKKLPPGATEARESVLEMLKGTKELSSDLHTLSHELHSSRLEHVGLVSALHGLCREMSDKYKIEVHVTDSDLRLDMPKDVALCLFRVAQEALGNVVKHSQAKSAQVAVGANATSFWLRVSDGGRGFDLGLQNARGGIGLIGMRERLRLVGGTLEVMSEPERGTEILAEVPLAASEKEDRARTKTVGR